MSAFHHSHLWLVCSDHFSPRSYCIPFCVPTDFLVTQWWADYLSSLSHRSKDPSYPPGMKCKRTGILRSEEIAVSPNSKNDADKKASDVFKIICCSPERKSCIAFVQTHFVTSMLVSSQHNTELVFTTNHLKNLTRSGSWRVGRVHLFCEHRPRMFRCAPRHPRCHLLHLWHRQLILVFSIAPIKSLRWKLF